MAPSAPDRYPGQELLRLLLRWIEDWRFENKFRFFEGVIEKFGRRGLSSGVGSVSLSPHGDREETFFPSFFRSFDVFIFLS